VDEYFFDDMRGAGEYEAEEWVQDERVIDSRELLTLWWSKN